MVTPARRQYLDIKAQHPDEIVLFRLGDFYEMFDDDAKKGAATLQITLTARSFGKDCRVPLAGIPYHALDNALARLLAGGHRVAICEQLSPPGRGLIERAVVRVLTPGTVVEPSLLNAVSNNYLAAVAPGQHGIGLAYADVSTGQFAVTEFTDMRVAGELDTELERIRPAEVIVPDGHGAIAGEKWNLSPVSPSNFDRERCREALMRVLGVRSLDGFGCSELGPGISAAGAIVLFLERTNRQATALLTSLRAYSTLNYMPLDGASIRRLEILENERRGDAGMSLLGVLDRSKTAMGARLLRRRLVRPLLDRSEIESRLNLVSAFVENRSLAAEIGAVIRAVGDIERVAARARQELATPREMLTLSDSLTSVSRIARLVSGQPEPSPLKNLSSALDSCPDAVSLIGSALNDSPAGPLIKPGFSEELDQLVGGIADSRRWLAELERTERERTGIRSLRVAFNRVFGYYIEVRKSNLHLVPPEYVRKQTIVGGERFITSELKESEAQILSAEERISEVENAAFLEIQRSVGAAYPRISRTAQVVAQLDVALALADLASECRYARPELHDGLEIEIVDGRHPVVEQAQGLENFIANDCHLDYDQRVLVLTGPNMGGKSTYLRQVALIVLLAQIGSFVPATSARIGIVDRIFTRIGANDDLAAGASTFMVEMAETANILHHATERSLVLLDEVGRGTSTFDGLSIARAVIEEIHDRIGCRTLFATHYQELASVAESLAMARNYCTSVAEHDGEVLFLHKVLPGSADRTYGIHVAKLAGIPATVTQRAEFVLHDLENAPSGKRVAEVEERYMASGSGVSGLPTQFWRVAEELLSLDIASMTPIEAMVRLYELQQLAKEAEFSLPARPFHNERRTLQAPIG